MEAVPFGASLTIAKGTIVARKASDNKWYAYNDAGSGGLEVARGIAMYSIVTDSSGNVFYGTSAVSEQGAFDLTAPIYVSGDFNVADLTGLDANGLADLGGHLIYGDDLADANAMVRIG
jgi:hypothetical protein